MSHFRVLGHQTLCTSLKKEFSYWELWYPDIPPGVSQWELPSQIPSTTVQIPKSASAPLMGSITPHKQCSRKRGQPLKKT